MILQRYTFGSKSQLYSKILVINYVVYDIAKIYIWKQITTTNVYGLLRHGLFMILQRYTFGSKSQHIRLKHLPACQLFMILQRYTFGSKSQQKNKKNISELCCL